MQGNCVYNTLADRRFVVASKHQTSRLHDYTHTHYGAFFRALPRKICITVLHAHTRIHIDRLLAEHAKGGQIHCWANIRLLSYFHIDCRANCSSVQSSGVQLSWNELNWVEWFRGSAISMQLTQLVAALVASCEGLRIFSVVWWQVVGRVVADRRSKTPTPNITLVLRLCGRLCQCYCYFYKVHRRCCCSTVYS